MTCNVQVLLKHGADWFDRNIRGETSFDLYKTVLEGGNGGNGGKLQLLSEVAGPTLLAAANSMAKATFAADASAGSSVRERLLRAQAIYEHLDLQQNVFAVNLALQDMSSNPPPPPKAAEAGRGGEQDSRDVTARCC